jgi:hypothetical protein
MKLIEVIATIRNGAVIALLLAGCSSTDMSFAPGLPRLLSSSLPKTCVGPDSYQPGSACAKDLAAAQKDENFRLRDNQDIRLFLDDACADDTAWRPGSTCHLVTDALQRAAASPPAFGFQPSRLTPMPSSQGGPIPPMP